MFNIYIFKSDMKLSDDKINAIVWEKNRNRKNISKFFSKKKNLNRTQLFYRWYNKYKSLPSFRIHMMMTFMAVAEIGSVICKLSIIDIISFQTLINENIAGIIVTVTNVTKMTKVRRFARNFCRLLNFFSGHKPTTSRVKRFIPMAHSKSIRLPLYNYTLDIT